MRVNIEVEIEVPQRDRQTLEPIIQILPCTRIVSNGRPPYKNIESIGDVIYTHDMMSSFIRRISSMQTIFIFISKILKARGVVQVYV